MLKKIVLVFAVVAVAMAQIPSLGWCPEYVPMANFEMERFLGVWYEAERYFQLTEVVSRCVTANYTRGPDGKLRVSNEVTNRFTGIKRVLEGEIKPTASKSEEGKLQVKYTTVPLTPETKYSVLETDYKNYAVLWSCSGIGPIHAQNAWVMTRNRQAPGEILQQAYGVLDKYKISKMFFVKTDQAECSYEAPHPAPVAAPAPSPAPVAESPAAVPVKEEPVPSPAAEEKSVEGVHLRSASILPEADAAEVTPEAETPVKIADAPLKLAAPLAEEPVVEEVRIANEPDAVPAEEKPALEEIKPQDLALKAIAPETIPEVILKVAESAKETVDEPAASPVAEESKIVEVAVPAESKPEIIEASLPSEVAEEQPKLAEADAKAPEDPKAIEAAAEEPKPEIAAIEEPKPAVPALKLAEEPVEKIVTSEVAEESKLVLALKSPIAAEDEAPLEEPAVLLPEKIEAQAPAEGLDTISTKSNENIVPVEAAEKIKIVEVPATAEVPADSGLLKNLAALDAEKSELVILEPAEPSKVQEAGEQLLKSPEASVVPETIIEPVVPETPAGSAAPLKSIEVPAEDSKPEAIAEVPKTSEAKP